MRPYSLYSYFACLLVVLLPLHVQTQASSELVAEYLFNNDAEDSSGNGNNGTAVGGLQYGEDRFGNACGAAEFNGYNSFITVPSSPSLSSPEDAITIMTWFKLNQGSGDLKWLTVCCKSDLAAETVSSPHYRLQVTRVTLSINTEFTENLNVDISLNTWHHYAMVYDGFSVRGYLDAQEVFVFPYSGYLVSNTDPLEIGRDVPGVEEYFSGSLDELRIYNRALTQREIRRSFQDRSEENAPNACPPEPVAATPESPTPTLTLTPNPTPTPPLVRIVQPANSPQASPNPSETIQARIQHVPNREDVTFRINGLPSDDFTYDPATGAFSSPQPLNPGNNLFEIIGTNPDGTDSDLAIVTYQPTRQPPNVTFINPPTSPARHLQETFTIKAKIDFVKDRSGVEFQYNGKIISNFEFKPATGLFSAPVRLIPGNNIAQIRATNPDGQDSEVGIVNYQPAVSPPSTPATVAVGAPLPPVDPSVGEVEVTETVQVRSSNVKIICYDHKQMDGDIVSVFLNDQVVVDKTKLRSPGGGEVVRALPPLQPGGNYLLISRAWNVGRVPPNTMTMEIHDAQGLVQKVIVSSLIGKSGAVRLSY